MSSRNAARALPNRRQTPVLEIIAKLSVVASVFSWLGVVLVLFWH